MVAKEVTDSEVPTDTAIKENENTNLSFGRLQLNTHLEMQKREKIDSLITSTPLDRQ